MDEAIAMYQELHRWEDAIAVAEARVKIFSKKFIRQLTSLFQISLIIRITLTLPTFTPPTSNGCKSLGKKRWRVR